MQLPQLQHCPLPLLLPLTEGEQDRITRGMQRHRQHRQHRASGNANTNTNAYARTPSCADVRTGDGGAAVCASATDAVVGGGGAGGAFLSSALSDALLCPALCPALVHWSILNPRFSCDIIEAVLGYAAVHVYAYICTCVHVYACMCVIVYVRTYKYVFA